MREIETFFNELACRWDMICKHDREKIDILLKLINIQEEATILDIGCGTGILESHLLPYKPKRILAVDLAKEMILEAKEKYTEENIEFRCVDVMNLGEEKFDYAIIYSAFPHFMEPDKFIAHISTLLNPGGKIAICHGQSKEQINGHHHENASEISIGLLPAKEVGEMLEKYFDIQVLLDTEHMYMVSGIKK